HIPQAVRSLPDEYFLNVMSFVDIAEELSLMGQVLGADNGKLGQGGQLASIRLPENTVQLSKDVAG
ncbi:MAG TPA: hypothetical protein PKZ24_11270, partial [Nitrospirales bacterium]|nr:hypothetical protein [Nitrospirales bacterium]